MDLHILFAQKGKQKITYIIDTSILFVIWTRGQKKDGRVQKYTSYQTCKCSEYTVLSAHHSRNQDLIAVLLVILSAKRNIRYINFKYQQVW